MELPNLFGLHIQASHAETLAKAYIGNFLAIENRSSRLVPNGGEQAACMDWIKEQLNAG